MGISSPCSAGFLRRRLASFEFLPSYIFCFVLPHPTPPRRGGTVVGMPKCARSAWARVRGDLHACLQCSSRHRTLPLLNCRHITSHLQFVPKKRI